MKILALEYNMPGAVHAACIFRAMSSLAVVQTVSQTQRPILPFIFVDYSYTMCTRVDPLRSRVKTGLDIKKVLLRKNLRGKMRRVVSLHSRSDLCESKREGMEVR